MSYLVIDVGGTAIKYALMNNNSEFLEKGEQITPLDSLESFVNNIEGIFRRYTGIKGIAMSIPGRVDSESGYAYSGGNLIYNSERHIAKIIGDKCGVKVTVENDGKCAALAEAWKGSLSDCDDGIVVILGTGIGGGIIKNKSIHKGKEFIAGELSFIITNTDIKKGEEIKMFAHQCGVPFGLCKPVAKIKGLEESEVNGKKVFELANEGDRETLDILDDYCYKLALQLHNLQHIYNPEKIAIGGGISSQEILMEYIQKNIEYINKHISFKLSIPTVVRCQFRNDANLIGALYHYKNLYGNA